ncbi:MAG: 2-hydroxyacyl-CoA dehydratase [Candidatus Hermodarchaeota archaeon]
MKDNGNKVTNIIPYKILLEVLDSTHQLANNILPENVLYSLKVGVEKIMRVLSDYIEKAKNGAPIVGYHFSLPSEYLSCFDIVPICIEGTSYFLSTLLLHGVEKYYDIMANYGHPFHTCTSQKGTMGMTLEDLFKFDAIIAPTSPCDCTIASYPFFKEIKNVPLFMLDMPYIHNEESFEYYAGQLRLGLEKLGQVIGQEPDYDQLKKSIEIENKVNQIKLEIFDLIKASPCPIDNMFNAISAGASIFISGTQENLEYYQEMYRVAKERYKKGEYYGGIEKIRSIWPYMITFFSVDLLEWLNRNLGLSVLFDIFNYNFAEPISTKSDLNTLYYDMARKSYQWPMVKQSTQFYEPFIEDCISMARDFNADCFIYTQSIACKQFGSIPTLLREALMEEVGIPTLLIEFDAGDERMTSIKSFKQKIEMFTNTLL